MNNKKKLIAATVLVASMILLILVYFAFGGRLKSAYSGQKEAGVSSQNDKNADNKNDESEDDNQSTGIFSIVNHKSNKITTDESVIAFSGTSNPVSYLTCNGNEVRRESNGDFSVEFDLTPGINTFLFKHGDEEYEYTVDYSVRLIKDVSPAGEMTLPGGMQVGVSATALRGCDIYIVFGGTEYRMKQAQGNTDEDSSVIRNSKDFTTYIGSFVIPASKKDVQNLGPFVIKASAGGFNEEVKGANIKVNAVTSYYHEKASSSPRTEDEDETTLRETTAAYRLTKYRRETTLKQSTTVNALRASRRAAFAGTRPVSTILSTDENGNIITLLPETTQPEATTQSTTQATTLPSRLKKYSSSTDYGLGSAKICTMIRDYVEIFPGNTTSTYSDPDYSPLIKDTQDYVTGIAKYDGDTYYILSCGAKVPLSYEDNNGKGSKTKVTDVAVTEGYIMPPNTIRLVSCESNDGEAIMKFDLNRKVPFIARLVGQSYSDYKVGRRVAVNECNATGLQIAFYDTVSAKGSFSFTDTVIRSASFSVKNKTATLSVGFKGAGKFYGFHYEYDKDGYLIFSFKKKPASLKGAVVMLDPGHGGGDSGAVCVATSSAFKGEKDINLAIAKTVKSILEDKGASVIMTRISDKFVSLTERAEMCHKYNPDLFISIHCDSASSSSSRGTSAYYYRAYSQPLAKSIHSSLVNTYKANIYGSNDSAISKGTSFYAFRVERVEECPSVLIEYGFVSNLRECSLLQNSTVRYSLAQATVNGIEKYIKNQ